MAPKLGTIPAVTLSEHGYLMSLAGVAGWRYSEGSNRQAEFFTNLTGFHKTLVDEERETILKIIEARRCYSCNIWIKNIVNQQDHVVPLSAGGARGMSNFALMCGPCNASKGSQDLIEWWLRKGRSLLTLSPHVLIVYVRARYALMLKTGELGLLAPAWARTALGDFSDSLPSSSHRRSFEWISPNLLPPEVKFDATTR